MWQENWFILLRLPFVSECCEGICIDRRLEVSSDIWSAPITQAYWESDTKANAGRGPGCDVSVLWSVSDHQHDLVACCRTVKQHIINPAREDEDDVQSALFTLQHNNTKTTTGSCKVKNIHRWPFKPPHSFHTSDHIQTNVWRFAPLRSSPTVFRSNKWADTLISKAQTSNKHAPVV